MKDDNKKHTYREVGFNRFFRRSLNSNPDAVNLKSMGGTGNGRQLNFDDQQVSGSLGDKFAIGKILLNGKGGQIDIRGDSELDVVVRIGDLDA